jgi:hypothetical protein
MPTRAAQTSRPVPRRLRLRLLAVLLAPLVVLVPFVASAATATQVWWVHYWNPPLALLSSYSAGAKTTAGFATVNWPITATGAQPLSVGVVTKTRWVDTKARHDSPNIVQQGDWTSTGQFKIQIGQGPAASAHRAQCRIKTPAGSVMATGPAINVANGQWHTITCLKSPDSGGRTRVVVVVDGVSGSAAYSSRALGKVAPPGPILLGGRSAVASPDSLDGWIYSLRIISG